MARTSRAVYLVVSTSSSMGIECVPSSAMDVKLYSVGSRIIQAVYKIMARYLLV